MSKNFVLDTNVLLTDPRCIIEGFEENNLIIPLAVIEELDLIKKESQERGYQAREVFRLLDNLIFESEHKNIRKGIKRNDNGGVVLIMSLNEKDIKQLNDFNFSMDKKDDLIVLTALKCVKEMKEETIFVSNDTNARLKAVIHDLPTEIYKNSTITKDAIDYKGYRTVYLPLTFFGTYEEGQFKKHKVQDALYLDDVGLSEKDITPNEFILLEVDPEDDLYCKMDKRSLKHLKGVYRYMDGALIRRDLSFKTMFGGVTGKNLEQSVGLDLLHSKDIKVVTLSSPAGGGKTFLSLACAMTKLLEKDSTYEKIVLVKPVVSVANEMGYLPGDVKSKLEPYMKSYIDNFEALRKMHHERNKESTSSFEEMVESGKIEVEAISYIRGRSIQDCIIIIDELQNVGSDVVKTILSRVGENTFVIVSGDPSQIDVSYLSKNNNGLTHLIKKFRGQEFYGHISFDKCVRSDVSEAAAKLL
jgi:PhoH-like ATPase